MRKPGDKERVTIKDVAKESGYSPAAVSYVLNKTGKFYSKETEKKILKVVEKLEYYPDAIAKGLKTKKTNNIAFMVPFIADFFAEVFLGVQEAVVKENYSVALYSSEHDAKQEKRNINSILSNRLDGIIIASAILDEKNIEKLIKENIPLVIIERFYKDQKVPNITIKNIEISKEAVNYLISLDHKNIGFISGPISIGKLENRFKGYKEALKENNLQYDKSHVFISESLEKEQLRDSYEYIISNIDKIKECTALFISSDILSISTIKAIFDSGVNVPDDISIIGFDGLEISKFVRPTISTIVQPRYDMGYKSMEMLLKVINNKKVKDIGLKAELVIRESTIKNLD
jgi:DNA-binding LacI/PurR family transcriptional regulator